MAFGFLKKLFGKERSSGLPKELNEYLAKIQKDVFPNGIEQQKAELIEVANLIGVRPERIINTFSYACSRAFIGDCDKDTLIAGISRHKDGLSIIQIEKFARFVFTKLIKQRTGVSDPVFIEESLNALGFLKDNYGGLQYDEIPGGFGEYGITITNPVPVNGIPSSGKYLSRLVTSDGLNIKWNRLGSGCADNIDNPIDIYVITDEKGQSRDTIYISPYHPSTSNKAPKGYRIR